MTQFQYKLEFGSYYWYGVTGRMEHMSDPETREPFTVSEVVDVEAGLRMSNLGALERLDLHREQMYAGLGISKEFIEGDAGFSTSSSSVDAFEREMRRMRDDVVPSGPRE